MKLAVVLLLLWGCQQDARPNRHLPTATLTDDFGDLQKNQEAGCTTEEDLEKTLAAKRDNPTSLQGANDGDCVIQ